MTDVCDNHDVLPIGMDGNATETRRRRDVSPLRLTFFLPAGAISLFVFDKKKNEANAGEDIKQRREQRLSSCEQAFTTPLRRG